MAGGAGLPAGRIRARARRRVRRAPRARSTSGAGAIERCARRDGRTASSAARAAHGRAQDVRRGGDVADVGAGHAGVPRRGTLATRRACPQPLARTHWRLTLEPAHRPLVRHAGHCRRRIVVQAVLVAAGRSCRCGRGGRSSSRCSSCGARRATPTRSRTSSGRAATWPTSTSGRRRRAPAAAWSTSSAPAFASSPSIASRAARRSITLDSARRAMRAAYQREIDALEAHLAGLATVGSVSPYIGLFGTVWGIMNAFRGLANVSQATLAQRRARHRRGADRHGHRPLRRHSRGGRATTATRTTSTGSPSRYETFIEEFSNILQRQG